MKNRSPGVSPIDKSEESYRRGVIFGLTMAEVLLLLLFCLLLLLAAKWEENQRLKTENSELTVPLPQPSEEPINVNELRDKNKKLQNQLEDERKINSDLIEKIKNQSAELKDCPKSPLTPTNDKFKKVPVDRWKELTTKEQKYDLNPNLIEYYNELPPKLKTILRDSHKLSSCANLLVKEENKVDWPPIITLSEADRYSFGSGSAKPVDYFVEQLKGNIKDVIVSTAEKYQTDIIEVIGHTDQQVMKRGRTTNLDSQANLAYFGKSTAPLKAKDNAGLGYARAVEVAKILKDIPELQKYTILPYSGGQLIRKGDIISDNNSVIQDPARRRIEIRVRRRSP